MSNAPPDAGWILAFGTLSRRDDRWPVVRILKSKTECGT